jgi:hypothetical protein
MNKKVLLFGVLTLAMVLASCDDLLDKTPENKYSNTPTYWNTTSNVDAQINTLYEQFYGYGNGAAQNGEFYFHTLSDDQAGNTFTDWSYKNAPGSTSDWSGPYTEIRRINSIIAGVTGSSLTDAQKANYLGIARLMRAYEYFTLVKEYGDVQWFDHALDPSETDYLYGKRDDRDAVMDNVLTDLNYAVANINDVSSATTFSRSMAQAMKANICLWEGTFRKYRTQADNGKAADVAGAEKYLKECVTACEAVMAKGYKLTTKYADNYTNLDLSKNTEMIFYKDYKKDVFMHSTGDFTCGSTQISGMTKDAFNSFLFLDGKPAATTTYANTDAGFLTKDSLICLSKLLKVRDKRLSVLTDSMVFYTGNYYTRAGADGEGSPMQSTTGYGVAKFDNTTCAIAYRNQNNVNYTDAPIFWLSVIYLNYAEAKAELGTATQADLDNTINKLMTRAGLPGILLAPAADPANNMGVSNLLWEIRRCRRCELMFDGNRYWDLVRWHQLDKLDSNVHPDILLGANVSVILGGDLSKSTKTASLTHKGDYIDGSKGMTRTYSAKEYYYPIPTGQMSLNPALTQNSGW